MSLNTGNAILSNGITLDSSYNVGIGGAATAGISLKNTKKLTGASTTFANYADGQIQTDATGLSHYFYSEANVIAATTATGIYHFKATQGTFGAGSSLTVQAGLVIDNSLSGAATNYGIISNINAADSNWNLYIGGSAKNWIASSLGIGAGLSTPTATLDVNGTLKASGAATFSSSVTAAGSITSTSGDLYATDGTRTNYLGVSTGSNIGIIGMTSNHNLTFITNNTERMRITSGGNVGIGTSSPTNPLHIVSNTISQLNVAALSGNTNAQINLEPTGTGVALIGPASAFPLTFRTDATERMRITSSGDLKFGNTGLNGQFIYGNSNEGYLNISGGQASGDSYGASITLVSNSRGGSNLRGELSLNAGNTGGAGSYINLITNGSERMRITSLGKVVIGATSTTYGTLLGVQNSGSSSPVAHFKNANNASGDTLVYFELTSNARNTSSYYLQCFDSGQDQLYIYGNGNVVNRNGSYGTISDATLKENIVDATPKLADILQLKVRNFNLIGDNNKQIGFIAQEFEEVFPSMINIDGKSGKKSIKTSVLIPMLVKAIQEQQAQIEAQQQQINSLINR